MAPPAPRPPKVVAPKARTGELDAEDKTALTGLLKPLAASKKGIFEGKTADFGEVAKSLASMRGLKDTAALRKRVHEYVAEEFHPAHCQELGLGALKVAKKPLAKPQGAAPLLAVRGWGARRALGPRVPTDSNAGAAAP